MYVVIHKSVGLPELCDSTQQLYKALPRTSSALLVFLFNSRVCCSFSSLRSSQLVLCFLSHLILLVPTSFTFCLFSQKWNLTRYNPRKQKNNISAYLKNKIKKGCIATKPRRIFSSIVQSTCVQMLSSVPWGGGVIRCACVCVSLSVIGISQTHN